MSRTRFGGRAKVPAWPIALSAVVVLLMVGGSSSASSVTPRSSTPHFVWTQISHQTNVTNNIRAMAWDPEAGHEIGLVANSSLGLGTYELDGSTWVNLHIWTPQTYTQRRGGPGPYGCEGAPALIYDASDRYLLLLAPTSLCSPVQLWKFQAEHWSYQPARDPPPTSDGDASPGLVYDASDGYVILYSGDFGRCDCYVNEMVGYHAGAWHRLANIPLEMEFPGGGSSIEPLLVYDPGLGKIVDFGNFGGGGGALQDWTYHTGKWEPLHITNRLYPASFVDLAYDPAIPGLLVTGITSGYFTWLWKDGATGFVNITSRIVNPDVGCLGPVYDPGLSALVCLSTQTTSYNAPWALWEFTETS